MSQFRAHVQYLFEMDTCRLQVAQNSGEYISILMEDGKWFTQYSSHTTPEGAGLLLPRAAMPVIAEAVTSYLGDALPSAGEVRTLREWLAVEQQRVDRLVEKTIGS